MLRKIIKIDEEKCNGCGLCIPNCHEGALQIIDGKARLISDLFCDGLGACIGHCPESAIEIIEREAEPYNETKVMEVIANQGRNTIIAHLEHLRDHKEFEFLKEAIAYIKEHDIDLSPEATLASAATYPTLQTALHDNKGSACGCSGSKPMDFKIDMDKVHGEKEKNLNADIPSELRQWPVQLHLLNPQASYFQQADVVLAADCAAFAMGDFHGKFLAGKSLAIACPKLDSNKESYIEKLATMISLSNIQSLTVVMMEVHCCGGLLQMVKMAMQQANKTIPVNRAIIGIKGDVLVNELI
jgi:ferredoxin